MGGPAKQIGAEVEDLQRLTITAIIIIITIINIAVESMHTSHVDVSRFDLRDRYTYQRADS